MNGQNRNTSLSTVHQARCVSVLILELTTILLLDHIHERRYGKDSVTDACRSVPRRGLQSVALMSLLPDP